MVVWYDLLAFVPRRGNWAIPLLNHPDGGLGKKTNPMNYPIGCNMEETKLELGSIPRI
jgi:hypothetical protein